MAPDSPPPSSPCTSFRNVLRGCAPYTTPSMMSRAGLGVWGRVLGGGEGLEWLKVLEFRGVEGVEILGGWGF